MTRETESDLYARGQTTKQQQALSEDDVLRLIEEAVLDQRLPPGTKLKEVHLAELFGVKRGLIRKVLTRLTNDRLVDRQPNRAATVANPSIKEGRDLFAARRAIERAIVETLTGNISKVQVKQLKAMLKKEHKAYAAEDTKLALSYSVEFHRTLAEMADNSVLKVFLADILKRTPLVILAHLGSHTQNSCANHEHDEIIDAMARGDAAHAVAVMDEHLLHIESRLNLKGEKKAADLSQLFFGGTH